MTERPVVRPNGFYRTPGQVYWLTLVTFGLYAYYYMIRERRLAQRRLNEPVDSYWTALKLVIPFYGIWYYFRCWNKIGVRVEAAGVRPVVPLGVLAIPMIVANVLWRLPDEIWVGFYVVAVVCVGSIAISVGLAERADEPDYAWPGFSVIEWIVAILCTVFSLLALLGLSTESASTETTVVSWPFFFIALALVFIPGIVFHVQYARFARSA
jgi:hypothetical protein